MVKNTVIFLFIFCPNLLFSQKDTSIISGIQLPSIEIKIDAASTVIDLKDPKLKTIISRAELKKAACCNLSESFETNPSIDVSFTDAITGTKQIQLFGLAGKYAQITTELTPLVRGLMANSGLSYIPGAWVQSIQLTKGIGSVTNGFESMTGQINVEILKPEDILGDIATAGSSILKMNNYINQGGRVESNVIYGKQLTTKWSLGILGHLSGRSLKMDNNRDSFADMPIGSQANGMIRARYFGQNGWESIHTFHILKDEKIGGQILQNPDFSSIINPWRSDMIQNRIAYSSKIGWVNPKNPNQSLGMILNGYRQNMNGSMGSIHDFFNTKDINANQIGGLAQILFRHDWGKLSQTSSIGFYYDNYDIEFRANNVYRKAPFAEQNIGVSSEWTWIPSEFFTLVAGGRLDRHSIILRDQDKMPFSPRMHIRIAPNDKNVFRIGFGEGFRMALPITEEWGKLASNREILWDQNGSILGGDQLSYEHSTNAGISYTGNFILNYMPGSITTNIHGTWFDQAVIQDFWTYRRRYIYPNDGSINPTEYAMISGSAGISSNYKLSKNTEIRLAYRYQNVNVRNETHGIASASILMPAAFVSKHRAMGNISRKFRNDWTLDMTLQIRGEQPIPSTHPWAPGLEGNIIVNAPAHSILNFQIRKSFENGDFYLGVENALNFKQENAIDGVLEDGNQLQPNHPSFIQNFDATRVWGPIFGRIIYLGFNYNLID